MTKGIKFGKQRKETYIDALSKGLRKCRAAEEAGVSVQTVWRHRKTDPDFAEAEQGAEIQACDVVEDALYELAKSGNVRAIEVWLYNRNPDRWQYRRDATIKNEIKNVVESNEKELYRVRDLLMEVLKDHPEVKIDLSKLMIKSEE